MGDITHSTPADGTFSAEGAAAWNAPHVLPDNLTLAGLKLTPITWAAIEALSSPEDGWIRVASDLGAAGNPVIYSGSRWKPFNGSAMLKMLGASVTGVGNTSTVVLQTLLPANAWKTNDIIEVDFEVTKSADTDSGQLSLHIGTAGSTADTAIFTIITLGTSNNGANNRFRVKLASATSVLRPGNTAMIIGTSTAVEAAAVTIDSATDNALYVSVAIRSTGTNDTVGISAGNIRLLTP